MPILVGMEAGTGEGVVATEVLEAGMAVASTTVEDPADGTGEAVITVGDTAVLEDGTATAPEAMEGGAGRASRTVLGGPCSAFRPPPRS